jgi:hypothetical protein
MRMRGLPRPLLCPALLPDQSPKLLVMVDTEEEFDWSQDFDRRHTGVRHLEDLPRLQALFEAAHIIPTYLVDYPVAASRAGADYFGALAAAGQIDVGMQLHPWVTPPHEEAVNPMNSYGCNLPADLEVRKLQALHDVIVAHMGVAPTVFKAGRYGVAHDTLDHVRALGILVDTSAMPAHDLSEDGGPDFSGATTRMQWFETPHGRILEIPTTGGFVGALHHHGPALLRLIRTNAARRMRVGGVLSRFNLFSRIRLSPEGYSLQDMQQLTLALHARGDRVFSLSLHSPSAGIGYTPYVRTEADRAQLFATIRDYVAWFRQTLGGETSTPSALYQKLMA